MTIVIILLLAIGGYLLWFFSKSGTVARRTRQAERRGILPKAKLIIYTLTQTHEQCYKDDDIEIVISSLFDKNPEEITPKIHDDIKIRDLSSGKLVFQGSGTYYGHNSSRSSDLEDWKSDGFSPSYAHRIYIGGYIPGEWENHLDLLHRRAAEAARQLLRDNKAAAKQRTRENFGL